MRDASGMVLSLVEHGWQAARECSVDLRHVVGVRVIHLIRGWVDPDVLRLIMPYSHITVRSIPRTIFWVVVWCQIFWIWMRGRLRTIVVDNDRARYRLRGVETVLHVPLLMIGEGTQGYEVWTQTQRLERSQWWELVNS